MSLIMTPDLKLFHTLHTVVPSLASGFSRHPTKFSLSLGMSVAWTPEFVSYSLRTASAFACEVESRPTK
jgi:hypothetical protein